MASTRAVTDPKTLAAAFSDQAQRTDALCQASRRARPVGKGMPIRNPAGKMSATVIAIFTASGRTMATVNSQETLTARSATTTATLASAAFHASAEVPTTLRLA